MSASFSSGVRARIENSSEHADVALSENSVPGVVQVPARSARARVRTRPNSKVYFIECLGGARAIKIGTTTDLWGRLSDLQLACPLPLRVMAAIPGGYGKEGELHHRFRRIHLRGEWFRAEPELLDFIESLQAERPEPRYVTAAEKIDAQWREMHAILDQMDRAFVACSFGPACTHRPWPETEGSLRAWEVPTRIVRLRAPGTFELEPDRSTPPPHQRIAVHVFRDELLEPSASPAGAPTAYRGTTASSPGLPVELGTSTEAAP